MAFKNLALAGYLVLNDLVMNAVSIFLYMKSIEKYMEYRMADQMPVGAILYSNVYGILGKTSKVDTLMHLWEEENQ